MIFLRGLLIGFAYDAPIGMANIYVFNNGLTYRMARALLYSFFVWVADASFSLAAFYGMGALINRNQLVKLIIMVAGGLLTAYIGFTIIRSANQRAITGAGKPVGVWQALFSAFAVIWANPQALVDGAMMLGASRGAMTLAESTVFILGVIIAAFIWTLGMTAAFNILKDRLPAKLIVGINLTCGLIILFYGLFLVESGLQPLLA